MGKFFSFRLGMFVFIITLAQFTPGLNAEGEAPADKTAEPEISMDFQGADLKDILKVFSMQSGLNFIASEGVQERKITLYIDKVPLNKAMDKLFKANNLSYELDRESNIFLVKDWGKPEAETITRVFYLKHATVSSSSLKEELSNQMKSDSENSGYSAGSGGGGAGGGSSAGGGGGSGKWSVEQDVGITKAVKKLISKFGSVMEDFRTNSLIVTDTPLKMEVISQVIKSLDVPVSQVMLEVEMLDVSKNSVDKLGIKFGQTPFTAVLTGASIGTMWPFSGTSLPFASEREFTPGSLAINSSSNTYTVLLDLLKTLSDTKILARPRILTLNNETAEIKVATQEAIGTITLQQGQGTASSTTTSAERVETGTSLRVTPQINPDTGEITMIILPTVKDATTSTFNSSFKDPEERSTKSIVRIKDGETVIIGGLIRNDRSQTITKLPLLGDLPLVGSFFRHKNKDKDRERELLVFITPHIVRDADTNIKLAQTQKLLFPEREQGMAYGFNRESAISLSLDTFEKNQ